MSCSPTGSYIPLTGLLFVLRQNVVYLRIFRLPTLPHLGIFIKIITAIRRYVIGAYHLKPYRLEYRHAVGFILVYYNHYMVGFIFLDF